MKMLLDTSSEDMSTVLEGLRDKTDGDKHGIDDPLKWKLVMQKAPLGLQLLSKQELKMLSRYIVREMVASEQKQQMGEESWEKYEVHHFVHSPELENFGIVFSAMIKTIAEDILELPGKHQNLKNLVMETLNGTSQFKCQSSSLQEAFQVLHNLPLFALSDKDRVDISFICIIVLITYQNVKKLPEEETKFFRDWCLMLATILDLSHETDDANIFNNIPPNLYFNWLTDIFRVDCSEQLNQTMLKLIEKSCSALFIHKDILLNSDCFEFVDQLSQNLSLSKSKSIIEIRKCVILRSLLKHLIHYWKTPDSDVNVKCEETLHSVRKRVNKHLLKQSEKSEGDFSVEYLQIVSTILNYECMDDSSFESANPNLANLLNIILWTLENTPVHKYHLDLISSILTQYKHFNIPLTKPMVKQIWNLLLCNVTSKFTTEDMDTTESDDDIQHQILNICKNSNPSSIQNSVLNIPHETSDLAPAVSKIFVTLMEFLDSEDLQNIFHQILEHLLKMYDVKQLGLFLNFWNEFLPMLFETKVKDFLPNTFCAILFTCNQIVEGVRDHSNDKGVMTIIMMIFSTIKSILQYNIILQDSNLAFLCLNTCQLVASGMTAPLEFIIPVFQEMCDVVFSFITNYENQAKFMLPTVLDINKMLVDVIFKYGYEGSNMDAEKLLQIENCANLITRLFMNYSKKKESFSKIAMYLIADYCCRSLKVTLHPKIKKEMIAGVYILMDICDEHRFKQLKRTLPSDVQFLFVKLSQDYQKYHKYQGKF